MATEPDQKTLQEAHVRSVYNGAMRLRRFADEPDAPALPNPFDAAVTVANAREMLEGLMQHRAPRDNIAYMAEAYPDEIGKFYRRVMARDDNVVTPADQPGFKSPVDEATMLQTIIGLTLTTTPDQVIIDFNRAAWASRQDLEKAGKTDTVEDLALAYEMQFYQGIMDRIGVTDRYAAQIKKTGRH